MANLHGRRSGLLATAAALVLLLSQGAATAGRTHQAARGSIAKPHRAPISELIAMLPKAELHVHVEGTLEPELMLKMANRNGVPLPYKNLSEARAARANYTDLQSFLDVYKLAMSVMSSQEDYYDLMTAYLDKAASQNIKHAEVFFDAQNHPQPLSVIMAGLHRAATDAQHRHGMTVQLILCFVRELPESSAVATLLRALPYRLELSTVGLASAEVGNPPEKFTDVYRAARAIGLHRVAHAGEEGGPDYVWSAINNLGVERVDHGIRSLEDKQLLQYMQDNHIAVTLCPISNKLLQVYKGQIEAKIREMLGSGVTVAISSDDPAFFGAYVNENYAWVQQLADLSPRQVADLAKSSFDASFLPPSEKMTYKGMVDAAYQRWQAQQEAVERS